MALPFPTPPPSLFPLPLELEPQRSEIERTVKPFVHITLSKVPPAKPMASRVGGLPVWPVGKPYPTDLAGHPMMLLAQINLTEVHQLPKLPDAGLLQFFISAEDELYGADPNEPTKPSNFRVVYHENLTAVKLTTDFTPLDLVAMRVEERTPIGSPLRAFGIKFTPGWMPLPTLDNSFDKHLPSFVYLFKKENRTRWDAYHHFVAQFLPGHRLGGCPLLLQADPRLPDEYNDYELLFQLDSELPLGIDWGGGGSAAFYISSKDLQRRDFSRVLYAWDQ